MAETELEQFRRKIAEAKAVKPEPVMPIEGVTVNPDETNGLTIATTAKPLDWYQIKKLSKVAPVNPSVTLTDAQMDAVTAYWTKTKEQAKP